MLNLKPLVRVLVLAVPTVAVIAACSSKAAFGDSVPCVTSLDCNAGHECSAGSCVAATSCDAARPCQAGQSCTEQVCRYACSSEEQCSPLGLRCELSAGLCLPKPTGSGAGAAGSGGSALAGSSSGGAGSVGGAPSAGTGQTLPAGGGSNVAPPTIDMIDDLEDGDGRIILTDERNGPWYAVTDFQGTPSATGPLTPEAAAEGQAIHFTLGSDSSSWGSGVGVDFKNPGSDAKATGRASLDASSFTGISFRVKGSGQVRLKAYTSQVVSLEEHGACVQDCFNAYGSELTLSSTWKSYVVPFKPGTAANFPPGEVLSLAQEPGWGLQTTFEPAQLMGLALQSAKAFDLWIDDLAFFKQGSSGSGGDGPVAGGECKDDFWPPAVSGSATRYDFSQGTTLPACSYVITHTGAGKDGDWDTVEGISTGDGGYFGAMNTTDYAQGAACGACVELSYQGKQVVITIVDECPIGSNPKCTKGHIDLSRKAIRQLQPNAGLEDLSGVAWRYVACPAAGNVKARLHPNASGGWQPVILENSVYPLQSVTLNGAVAHRSGNAAGGNAWAADGQNPPFAVRAVDVTGSALDATFSGGNSLLDLGKQFACQ